MGKNVRFRGGLASPESPGDLKQAAGLASEMHAALEELKRYRAEGTADSSAAMSGAVEELEDAIEGLRSAEEATPPSKVARRRGPSDLDRRLADLPPEARELAYQLQIHHLTADQYRNLGKGPLKAASRALRRAGIVVPVTGLSDGGDEERAYWFPSRDLLPTVVLSRPEDSALPRTVRSELQRVGYLGEEREAR